MLQFDHWRVANAHQHQDSQKAVQTFYIKQPEPPKLTLRVKNIPSNNPK